MRVRTVVVRSPIVTRALSTWPSGDHILEDLFDHDLVILFVVLIER
jgi:hypothetical protein